MTARRLSIAALLATVAVVSAVILTSSRAPTVVHAQFADAGQLVRGAVVTVAGKKVGSIQDITLTPNGLADVELAVTDRRYRRLHAGTRARIRANGQAGITNRYIDLVPGPSTTPVLPSPVVLATTQTSGIVDLDQVLNAFGPDVREDVRAVVTRGSEIFAGSGSRYLNGVLAQASPALEETARLADQLTREQGSLERLVTSTGTAATALAARPDALEGAVARTADLFATVADERSAFSEDIRRLHAVLPQARTTLRGLDTAAVPVRTALKQLVPAAAPLDDLLRAVPAASDRLRPVAESLTALAPDLQAGLRGLRPVERDALPLLQALEPALQTSLPILDALRVYTPDLILGVFGGLGGIASAGYDASGHYGRVLFVGAPEVAKSGILRLLPELKIPGAVDLQFGADAPCPGGGAEPALDGSNVWVPFPGICELKDNHP